MWLGMLVLAQIEIGQPWSASTSILTWTERILMLIQIRIQTRSALNSLRSMRAFSVVAFLECSEIQKGAKT